METPNVIIKSPRARKIARTTLDVIGAILAVAIAVDGATDAFNLIPVTTPILAGWGAARAVFGLTVDNGNTPQG